MLCFYCLICLFIIRYHTTELFSCPADYFKCPESFCIERQYVCDGTRHCLYGEDEDSCHSRSCTAKYRCLQSSICLPRYYLCDGFPQCPLGDDERMCDFSCPGGCTCEGFAVTCEITSTLGRNNTITIPLSTRLLDFSGNNEALKLSILDRPLNFLVHLNISSCRISSVTNTTFSQMMNLIVVDLSWNRLISLPTDLFAYQSKLKTLSISNNHKLFRIQPYTFAGLRLDCLDLSENRIQQIEDNAFAALVSETIYLNQTQVILFSADLFTGIEHVGLLVTNALKFCCIKPYFLANDKCVPHVNKISSCDDLLQNEILRPFAWTIGLTSVICNVLAFISRMYDKERLKLGYGIFVSNLAVSDFLMGIYLVTIVSADVHYRGNYMLNDDVWRTGGWCKLAGVLATLSSETSVLFICLVSIDRLLVVKFPFGNVRLRQRSSWILVSIAWILGLFISTFPLMHEGYFKGEFYSRSSVCLALPLTSDRPAGWLYSVLIFIVVNFVMFAVIAVGQWLIFREVTMPADETLPKNKTIRKRELNVARNLLVVAMTDFICWFPVGILGLLALSGVTISGEVYSWITVFVLPINSALNPFLYTLFAAVKKDSMLPTVDENIQTLTFPKDKVENLLTVWQLEGFFMNADTTGYEKLSPMMAARAPNLRWKIETAKALLKLLIHLHDRDIAQEKLTINDVYIKPSSFDGYSVQLMLNVRTELAYKTKAKAGNIRSFGDILGDILKTHKTTDM